MKTFLKILLVTLAVFVARQADGATITGPIYLTYSNRPYAGSILIRPLSTPLPLTPNLITGGDFKVNTDANGTFSVDLSAGNYRVQVGADKPFVIDVPTGSSTYTLLERITNSLSWNSSIIPSTNSSTATIISYTNVAQMVAASVPTSSGNIVSVLGRNTANDGGGGFFWFDSTSSASTNLGTVFAPASGSGRWFRIVEDSTVNVRMFGAKGDGTTDDSAAFQAALDWRDSLTGRPGTVVIPAGRFRVSGLVMTGGKLKGVGNVERGSDVATKTASVLEHTLGATADLLTVNAQNAGGGPSAIIEDILFLGHPEYNLRGAQTITAVYSGDRLHFDVASAPSIEGAKGSHPYLGFGALYTDENRYLGTFMLQSFITNGSGSSVTNTVNIATGTDAYATVSGENILRTGFKVCFPKSQTWYSGGSSMGARSFSHMAGYSAIVLWDSDECLIRNVKCVNWHTGLAVDSPSVVVDGYETYNCNLSGMIAEPFGFLADSTVYGFILLNGKYQLDDALVPNSYTLKNTMYRYSAIGIGLLGAQAKLDNIVAGPSALYGGFFYGGTHSHINNLLIESPAGVPLYFPLGNSASPQAFTSISRLRVLSGYAADTIPDNRRNDLAIVEVNTSAARVAIAQASVAPFTSSGTSTNWTWAFWYKWPNTSTDTLVGIGQYEDVNQMVPRGSQKPGGAYNAQRWQMMGGVQVVGGAATEPIITFARDVAEPNANKVGLTYSGGAKLLYAHNGDGIVNDVGYTLESNTSATQLTLGDLSGVSSPRTGIIQGEPASGTDISGGSTHIRAGTGTGAASNSSILFYTPAVGSSGTSSQTQTLRLTLGQGGQLTFSGLTADPTVGTATGSIYYNSASNSFRWHNGTSWANLGSGGGGGGSGDVVGPASATDGLPALFDGTTGKLIKNSKVTLTQPATGSTLTIADGKTLTANNSITLAGTDSTVMTFPSTSASIARTDAGQTFSGVQVFAANPEIRNGTSGTDIEIFKTYSGGGANYESLRIDGGITAASEFSIKTLAAGTGAQRALSIYGGAGLWLQSDSGNVTLNASSSITLRTASSTRWNIGPHIIPQTANTVDIGSSSIEVRAGYFGNLTVSYAGAASTPGESITGAWFTGGTSTTTKPQLLIEPTGTTSTGWSTSGTGLGVNAASGFAGNLVDVQVAGASRAKISSAGDVTAGKYNNVTVTAGTGTPALTVNGTASVSGTNTGDQQIGGATGWRFYEEFNWNSAGSGGSGWLSTSSGGANSMAASPSANRPGIFQFSTSTSTTGNPNLIDNGSALFLGGGALTMEWSARLTTALPDTNDDYDVWMGLGDQQTTSSQTDGVYFLLDRGVSATDWQFVTAKAGTRQTSPTGIAANGSGTWQKFRFEVNAAATQVIAYIDGVACATNTTFIPDTSSNLCGKDFGMLKQGGSIGTTARIMQLDYVWISQDFTSSR